MSDTATYHIPDDRLYDGEQHLWLRRDAETGQTVVGLDALGLASMGDLVYIVLRPTSFNPEPGTALQDAPRAPLARHRRIQLVKYLIEQCDLPRDAIAFDEQGAIVRLDAPGDLVETAIARGLPFMTNGCPDRHGAMTCNRPYGSYRPGEPFRDYPFQPSAEDIAIIREELRLEEIR